MEAATILLDDDSTWKVGEENILHIDLKYYKFITGIRIRNGNPGVKKIRLYYFDSLEEMKWKKLYFGELEDGNELQILNFNKTFPVRQIVLIVVSFHGSSDAGFCATKNINS